MQKPQHILAILAVTQLLALPAALAQETTRQHYQLAGAPLDKTLLRIAADSGVALAYDPRLLEAARSAPVSGNYSAVEAISRALEGSGFELVTGSDGRTLTVRRSAAPAANRALQAALKPVVQRAPVAAATAPAAAAAAATNEVLARVTVSGAKRPRDNDVASDVQRTPTSSYRVTGDELEEQNITALEDLQQLVPGLVIQSTDPSDTQISIRGVGDGGGQASGDANIGMPSSVAVYLDKVYLARPGMLGNGLGDIAYAEVLSGAQGTMFGANATGGVLNIQTREPSFTPEASASVSVGQRGYRKVQGMVSGPLSEHWAGRLNLISSNTDGNVTNLRDGARINGQSSNGARAQLLFRPNDSFSLRLSADFNNSNSSPTAVLLATHTVNGKDTFLTHSATVGNHVVLSSDAIDLDDVSQVHATQGGVSAVAEWKLDSGYQLHSVSSYRYFQSSPSMADSLSVRVYSNTGTAILDRTWNQEFRLDSPTGKNYDYAVGLSYLGQNLGTVANTRYGSAKLPGLYYDATSYNGLTIVRLGTLHDHMLSPFLQGTLHINPKLDLTAGVRANYEEKGGQFIRYNKANFNSGWLKEYHLLPSGTLVLNYKLAPEWSSYLAASYGEKSGGLNISAGAAAKAGYDSLYIKPEKTRSTELGLKGSLWDGKANLKADLFLTEVSDFQTQGYNPDDQQTYLLNAGSFRSRGAEATLQVDPTRNLKLSLAGVYNDAYYTDYANARCGPEVTLGATPPASCNLTGQRVFNAPKVTWNANARYTWRSESGLLNFVSARYAYRGWMYGTVDNSQFSRIDGYGIAAFSAGTGAKLARGVWNASIWVNNAFDKTYYRRVVNGDYGSVWGWRGDPRTVGATLSFKY